MINQLKKVYICEYYVPLFDAYREMINNPDTHYEHFNYFNGLARASLDGVDLIITAIKPLTSSKKIVLPEAGLFLKKVMDAQVPILFASGYELDSATYEIAVKDVLTHPFYLKKTSGLDMSRVTIDRCLIRTKNDPQKYFSVKRPKKL